MTAIIEAEGVCKRFGRVEALAGIDLVVEPGDVVALLGPNGAGKTTFVRALSTLVRPDAGRLLVDGHDVVRQPAQVRTRIGLAGQHAAVEATMTGRENLEMVARLYGLDARTARRRAAEVVASFGLGEVAERYVRTYSGGQRRRLDLGASLVGTPKLLLLDEPTTGLDPRSRIELWDAVRRLAEAGTNVLLTTQYLEEADRLAARVVIIDHGRVIADGSPAQLKARAGGDVIEVHVARAERLPAAVAVLGRFGHDQPAVDTPARQVSVAVDRGTEHLAAVARALDDEGIDVDDLGLRRPTLDEVFLALTGQAIETTTETSTEADTKTNTETDTERKSA